eukprot:7852316-Pyramimonas_sp.AAC.1
MADAAPPARTSTQERQMLAELDEMPTFPDGERSGKGQGTGRFTQRKRQALAPSSAGAPVPSPHDDDDDDGDFLRQLCREEFASMRDTITTEVSESVAKTITSNHNTLLKMLSSMQGEVAKQSSAIESQ